MIKIKKENIIKEAYLFLDGKSFEEIGKIMGVHSSTVSRHFQKLKYISKSLYIKVNRKKKENRCAAAKLRFEKMKVVGGLENA